MTEGGKTFKERNKMTREPVFSVILSGVTHYIFSNQGIRNKPSILLLRKFTLYLKLAFDIHSAFSLLVIFYLSIQLLIFPELKYVVKFPVASHWI